MTEQVGVRMWTSRIGLAEQVVEILIGAIADGRYPPDSRMPPEADLAQECDVSRLTLREAVKALRAKGVLRVEQGRGTFVNPRSMWSPLDPALLSARVLDTEDTSTLSGSLTEARRIVEVGVAELAAMRRSDGDLESLTNAVGRMTAAHEQDDAKAFTTADIDFHDVLIRASGNAVLAALFQPIDSLLRVFRYETSRVVETRAQGLGLHVAIADAISAGSPEAARETMLEHFRHTEMTLRRAHGG